MTKLKYIKFNRKEINTIPTIDNLFLYKVVNEHNPLFLGKELKEYAFIKRTRKNKIIIMETRRTINKLTKAK